MTIAVRARPGAGADLVGGRWDGPRGPALLVAVRAGAVQGAANVAVVAAVAGAFGLRRGDVTLVSGARGRNKVLASTATRPPSARGWPSCSEVDDQPRVVEVNGAAARRWAELQSGRGIPPEILARAEHDPWRHDVSYFAAPARPVDTPSRAAGLALVGDAGTVIDVGCGGGDAAFALAGPATQLVGVDRQQDMLDVFAADARARGIPHRTVLGAWPDVAAAAGTADVVVSNHVLHNVVDLPPFLLALTAAAGRGVVVEMLGQHPMAWLDPLWERFHDLRRPPPATTDDAVAVLRELGIEPVVTRWERRDPPRQDPVWVTRRLCLPAAAVPEVGAALDALVRPRIAATLTWTR